MIVQAELEAPRLVGTHQKLQSEHLGRAIYRCCDLIRLRGLSAAIHSRYAVRSHQLSCSYHSVLGIIRQYTAMPSTTRDSIYWYPDNDNVLSHLLLS